MLRSIKRSFTEGLKGMLKNGLMTITSIFVVTSCIFVFGLFLMITFNMNHITDSMAKNYQMQVYIERPEALDDTDYEKYRLDVENKIKNTPNIDSSEIEFITGEKYFNDFKKSMNERERESFDGLPDNFIPDMYVVKMEDISKNDETLKKLKSIEGVESVENKHDLVKKIKMIGNVVKKVSIWVIVIFALVSLFIISNTIKLTVHNRRKEINIMKYVGATDRYIKGPFIMEGILVGLISAAVAFFISQWIYVGISESASVNVIITLLPFEEMWKSLIGAFVVLGCLIGAFGSSISVRRYLKV